MPNIDLTKAPEKFNLAYGKNIVSLFDVQLPSTINRFYLRVKDLDDSIIAQVKQIPNISGYAHFDIQNILKNKVTHNPAIETTPRLTTAKNENWTFVIDYGFDNTITDDGGTYSVLNGRKEFNEIEWNFTQYTPVIGGTVFGGIDILYFDTTTYCRALTDRHIKSKNYADITDGKPASWLLQSATKVWFIDKYNQDDYTLTWLNDYRKTSNPLYQDFHAFTNGINGFRFAFYNAQNTLIADTTQYNLTTNGGGPDTDLGDNIQPAGEYNAITLQTSALNSVVAAYPTAKYYYVAPVFNSNDPSVNLSTRVVGQPYRFNIIDGDCDDDNHIQVSWVNSFGFRDYFTFTKKNNYRITTEQNTYKQLDADWSAPTIEVNPYNRGERVFNKSRTTTYEATTRILTDAESQYLENLFVSPDVKIKTVDSKDWTPVILTNTEFDQRRYKYDKVYQLTITFRIANKKQIQRG